MIDENKLIKEIRMLINSDALEGHSPAAVLYEVYDRIMEMPKTGGWISVNDRLPEDDEYILLSFENFPVPAVGRYEADSGGGAFYAGDDDESCVTHGVIVNAWMPLPQPWKRGSETWEQSQTGL